MDSAISVHSAILVGRRYMVATFDFVTILDVVRRNPAHGTGVGMVLGIVG